MNTQTMSLRGTTPTLRGGASMPCVACGLIAMLGAGCNTATPTTAIVTNAYPPAESGAAATESIAVYKVWWTTTLFDQVIAAGEISGKQRTVFGNAYAYAVLAIGADRLIPVRSRTPFSVARGDTLQIEVSDATFAGRCDASKPLPLSQRDADFITERIFPAVFADVHYDAATCTAVRFATNDGGPADAAISDGNDDGG